MLPLMTYHIIEYEYSIYREYRDCVVWRRRRINPPPPPHNAISPLNTRAPVTFSVSFFPLHNATFSLITCSLLVVTSSATSSSHTRGPLNPYRFALATAPSTRPAGRRSGRQSKHALFHAPCNSVSKSQRASAPARVFRHLEVAKVERTEVEGKDNRPFVAMAGTTGGCTHGAGGRTR